MRHLSDYQQQIDIIVQQHSGSLELSLEALQRLLDAIADDTALTDSQLQQH